MACCKTGNAMQINAGNGASLRHAEKPGLPVTGRSCAASFLSILAWLFLLAPAAADAQIVVNGSACPGATIQFTSAGNFAVLPVGCAGNGNPCPSATIEFSTGLTAVTAPPACLNATLPASQNPSRSVTVNGYGCNAAIVNWTPSLIVLDAPLSCITGVPVAPALETYVTLNACPGLAVTVAGTQNAIDVPGACSIVPHAASRLLAAGSRKTHGAAGTFNAFIDTSKSISDPVSVESRRIGNGHVIAFLFDTVISRTGVASVIDSLGSAVDLNVQYAGSEVLVTLPTLPDNRRVSVSLTGVNGSTNASASMGFLVGDVNSSRSIDFADVLAMKARTGQVTDSSNFMYDLKLSGRVNAADLATVKARQTTSLVP